MTKKIDLIAGENNPALITIPRQQLWQFLMPKDREIYFVYFFNSYPIAGENNPVLITIPRRQVGRFNVGRLDNLLPTINIQLELD